MIETNFPTYVIGVAGGSGSGKTTVVKQIISKIGSTNVVVVQHDWYYKHNNSLSFEERDRFIRHASHVLYN